MAEYRKPLPLMDPLTKDYWEGARRHELVIQHCTSCKFYIHPPMGACPKCQGDVAGETVSGKGSIYSFTIMHNMGNPGFEEDLPYAVVIVELAEQKGLFTVANLRDCPIDKIKIGMPVVAVFEDVAEDVTLPQFKRA